MSASASLDLSHVRPKHFRIEALDVLRGCALAAMFVYHLVWDFGYFGLVDRALPTSDGFKFFGHCIAVTFLALAGAGLVLSAQQGLRWSNWLKRLGMIGAAAAAVTIATYRLFPDSFIFFGILHCIAAATIVATPFLRLPAWLGLLAGALIFAAPFAISNATFDQPIWWWTGFGTEQPPSNDWRPFFPWVAFTLFGLAAMKTGLARGLPSWFTDWRATKPAWRLLALGGKHSLAIYLVHQPIFLAIIFVVVKLTSPDVDPEEAQFRTQCEAQCVANGGDALVCAKFCGCVVGELQSATLWRKVLVNALSPMERERLDVITRQCSRNAAESTPLR